MLAKHQNYSSTSAVVKRQAQTSCAALDLTSFGLAGEHASLAAGLLCLHLDVLLCMKRKKTSAYLCQHPSVEVRTDRAESESCGGQWTPHTHTAADVFIRAEARGEQAERGKGIDIRIQGCFRTSARGSRSVALCTSSCGRVQRAWGGRVSVLRPDAPVWTLSSRAVSGIRPACAHLSSARYE